MKWVKIWQKKKKKNLPLTIIIIITFVQNKCDLWKMVHFSLVALRRKQQQKAPFRPGIQIRRYLGARNKSQVVKCLLWFITAVRGVAGDFISLEKIKIGVGNLKKQGKKCERWYSPHENQYLVLEMGNSQGNYTRMTRIITKKETEILWLLVFWDLELMKNRLGNIVKS